MEPIAIVGIGCRFPGVEGPAEFWSLLERGAETVGEIPADRWDVDAHFAPQPRVSGKMNTRRGGFLSGVDLFDAPFFGISPREATRMDPQQRLALETAWHALEDAGIPAPQLAGSQVGVFLGFGVPEYFTRQVENLHGINEYTNSGNTLSMIANRISYTFDFRGPSLVLDTACSSSLVAVHLACQSLRFRDSSLALAGGVNLMLGPATTIGFAQLTALSADGRCKSFDAAAGGYVRGEGVGMVVLKRLEDALEAGDDIYAVIRGGAVNQDGRSNGITAPNRHAQEAVLRAAYRNAGVSPGDLQYVEAHGSGTLLGDPIEAKALGAVLAEGRNGSRCLIGSVKTNIGHAEGAAGVAGLIKTALAIRHGMIPASLHFQTPNPHIDFDRLPLAVAAESQAWPTGRETRLAGVSAFGYGGTNAHLVLESPPAPQFAATPLPAATEDAGPQLLVISGRSEEALRAGAEAFREFLLADEAEAAPLSEVCRAAAVGRAHLEHRLALVAENRADAARALAEFLSGDSPETVVCGRKKPAGLPEIALVYGDPSEISEAAVRKLHRTSEVFRAAVEECEHELHGPSDPSYLPEEVEAAGRTALAVEPRLIASETRTARFTAAYAITRLLLSWGMKPRAAGGHWLGLLAAAAATGSISLAEAFDRLATYNEEEAPAGESSNGQSEESPEKQRRVRIEIGPVAGSQNAESVRLPLLVEGEEAEASIIACATALYTLGFDLNWPAIHETRPASRVKLPLYRFQRRRYWIDDTAQAEETQESSPVVIAAAGPAPAEEHGYFEKLSRSGDGPSFEIRLAADSPAWLGDHRIRGAAALPGTGVMELALAAAEALDPATPFVLEGLSLEQMIVLTGTEPRRLNLAFEPAEAGYRFQLTCEAAAGEDIRCAVGRLLPAVEESAAELELEQLFPRLTAAERPERFYPALAGHGLEYGPAFRGVSRLWSGEREALGRIELPAALEEAGSRPHPALLDAALQVIAIARDSAAGGTFVPVGLERLRILGPLGRRGWSHVKLHEPPKGQAGVMVADVRVYDDSCRLAVEILGIRLKQVGLESAPQECDEEIQAAMENTSLTRNELLALPAAERSARLLAFLRLELAHVMEMEPAELDVEAPLFDLGLDSLVMFRLASQVEKDLEIKIPVMELLSGPSLAELSETILNTVLE